LTEKKISSWVQQEQTQFHRKKLDLDSMHPCITPLPQQLQQKNSQAKFLQLLGYCQLLHP
jgi:hypothetical protein